MLKVFCLQSMPFLQRDQGGRLLNALGRQYALIHQYDRSQLLKDQYRAEWTWQAPSKINK